jgi:peptide deformylase
MAILEILKYPEAILNKMAAPVKNFNGKTAALIDDMLETMYAAPGVGLAAPQVGVSQRIVVWEEGCLSVVDYTAEVRRAAQVEVAAFDEKEKPVKIEAEGLLAVALQHEIDHLDGKLFIDRISRLKRDLYTRRRKKMLRSGVEPPSESPRVMI